MHTCVWCDKQIPEDSEVFALGTRPRDRTALRAQEGKEIPVVLAIAKKTIPAMVTTTDSQAKREGNDLLFMVCSRECGARLKDALQEEKDLFDDIRALNLSPGRPPS